MSRADVPYPAQRDLERKRAPRGAPFSSQLSRTQLPVALSMLTDTPGPMVELIDTFFM